LELAEFFEAETELFDSDENFNVTPTSDIRVIHEDENGQRQLDLMFWGLVPIWAEKSSDGIATDQCPFGNSGGETIVSVRLSAPSVHHPRRWFLRVGAGA
jgi:putative SOS response-associated peptidase YedK